MTTTNTAAAAPRTITAKYPGTCPSCNGSIAPGTPVLWSPGAKARHVVCGGAPTAASAPARRAARPGRWTGCSCGSREDTYGDLIYSPRNCSSCTHDSE